MLPLQTDQVGLKALLYHLKFYGFVYHRNSRIHGNQKFLVATLYFKGDLRIIGNNYGPYCEIVGAYRGKNKVA